MTNCHFLVGISCLATCRKIPFLTKKYIFFFLLSLVCDVLSLIKSWATTRKNLYPHCLLNHPILFLKVCHCCKCGSAAILSDVSYQDGLNRCLKNFPQPIYSPRHLLIGAAVPVSSKTLRTWTEQLEFSLTTLANPGHGGHGMVGSYWSNGPDKPCVINPFNSALFLNSTPSLFQT